ncbi:hypothetical protein ACVNPX_09565 [Staphylococcus aureus]
MRRGSVRFRRFNSKRYHRVIKTITVHSSASLIYSSHDMGVINEICDRVAVMKNGEIVELNNTEDIIKHPQSDYAKQLISEVAVIAK